MIDSRAVVSEGARIADSASVGPYAIIGPNVVIGENVTVGPHAIVDGWTTIGENCRIFPHSAVGMVPQDLKYHGEKTLLEVGPNTTIREFSTLNIGTENGGGLTKVGANCLLMAYSHVAHDCIVGNNVILANAATLAGHVVIEDFVIIGGLTAVHQFVRVGSHSILGGCSAISLDVPPFVTASGNRAKLYGLNLVGLKRRGFDADVIKALKNTYRILMAKKAGTFSELLVQVKESGDYAIPEVKTFVDFIANSERGVTR